MNKLNNIQLEDNKIIKITENGYLLCNSNLTDFIIENQDTLTKKEIEEITTLKLNKSCFISSGQGFTKITLIQ
tara:strand:+ start:816 stop:1034 length:219 start_codon:yes stop_codon:yes gene_type:complete